MEDWKTSYPAVDVEQELREIRQWLISHPTRQKTAKGIRPFITNWLAKEQDKGRPHGKNPETPSEAPLLNAAKRQARAVIRAVETIGHTGSPRFDDPVTSHVVSHVLGWGRVCQMPVSQHGMFIRDFSGAYLARVQEVGGGVCRA